MTEEEKKQIQIINNFIMYCRGFEERKYTDSELFLAMENVSDLIQKQQAEIEKKNKMIDSMIKVMINRRICNYFIKNYCKHYAGENKLTCDECIKQYFEKK